MKKTFDVLTALFVFIGSLSGCGYQLQGGGSVLPPEIKKVYIPIVQNDTTEGGIANVFTEALRDEFERFGVVSVVDDSSDSDATLDVRIKSVKRTTKAVTSKSEIALQYDLAMLVSAELTRRNGAILYRNDGFTISDAYGAAEAGIVSSSSTFAEGIVGTTGLANLDARQVARSQEQQALEQIVSLAARRIYQDAVAPDF